MFYLALLAFGIPFVIGACEGIGWLPKHESPPHAIQADATGFWTKPRCKKGLLP